MHLKAHWLEEYSNAESTDILRELALTHCSLAGAEGKKIAGYIHRQDFKSLCAFELDYTKDLTVSEFAHLRQALGFFTKLEDLDIGIDKEEAAWKKFVWAEDRCRETNRLFKLRRSGKFQFFPEVESQLFVAQQKIAQVLGPFPGLSKLGLRFGKGATTLTKKRSASVVEKLGAGVSCSEGLFPLAKSLLEEVPAWLESLSQVDRVDEDGQEWASVPVVIHEGKLEFVPKNAKTYRATVTEPVLNGIYQLALGDFMVRRMTAFGVDLKDQTLNQRRALEGSLTGALATLDQTSASDLMALELIYDLLPLDWAVGLARARTGKITYKGWSVPLQMFSSMGNGFTFPLESLIFWALACAVVKDTPGGVSVFGDDVIVPSEKAADVIRLYEAVGFTLNRNKSYSTGPFRESCGKDFYKGIDIRPYYQKDLVSARTLFVLHNFYVRRLDYERAEIVLRMIHPSLQIWGPDDYGDGHLVGDHPMYRKPSFERKGWRGYTFDTFSILPRKDIRPKRPGDCVLPSYSVYRRSAEHLVPIFKDVVKRLVESRLTGAYSMAHERFLARFNRGFGQVAEVLPITDHKLDGGEVVKAVAMPLSSDSYRRISIYILG